ncbi:hypothetical protein N7493_001209 [Penicillium malachiteum]|uniref:Uncharacterized protein n=1 Tax=Penicillium malachiteum TaxID=1324776 RepID=A0AAD6HU98_9EURO|nr:hypothetical protein N7493_001209 [Penicillium malachiteum]
MGFTSVVKILIKQCGLDLGGSNGLKPLHFACMGGHIAVVELLEHADMKAIDNRIGWTPLHFAADNGDKEIIKLLIKRGALIEMRDDQVGRTSLHIAAMSGHEAVVHDLLQLGARNFRFTKDRFGWTSHQFAELNEHRSHQNTKAISANGDIWTSLHCKVIIEGQAGLKSFFDTNTDFYFLKHNADTRLRVFMMDKELGAALRLLLKNRSVRMADDIQLPQYILAQRWERPRDLFSEEEKLEFRNTLDKQLNPFGPYWHGQTTWLLYRTFDDGRDAQNSNNQTPLHLAASEGHEVFTLLLLQMGANPNARDSDKRTPLHLAASEGYSPRLWSYLHTGVTQLLVQNGADIEAKDDGGQTPLHRSACYGTALITKALLRNGAEKDAKDQSDRTPLHYAISQNHKMVARVLLQVGADTQAKDRDGCTPLFLAARTRRGDLIQLLLEFGADSRGARVTNGNTPVQPSFYVREIFKLL